jgi:hypothetical protein
MLRVLILALGLLIVSSSSAADISKLNGEWYSHKWKYGYTLKDGKGYATIVNSPNFKEGQEIVRLAALSDTSFFGENVYKDGKFYKVKVTLKPDGKLLFEGEKNAKWEIEKITPQTLAELKKTSKNIEKDSVAREGQNKVPSSNAVMSENQFVKIDRNNCDRIAGISTGYVEILARSLRTNPVEVSFRGAGVNGDGICRLTIGYSGGIASCVSFVGVSKNAGKIIAHTCSYHEDGECKGSIVTPCF